LIKPLTWQACDITKPQDPLTEDLELRQRFMQRVHDNADHLEDAPWTGPRVLDTFIDIGAHAGVWTTQLAPWFTQVQAWEPEHWPVLCRNAQFMRANNISIRPHAVSDRQDVTDFWSSTTSKEGEIRTRRQIHTHEIDQDPWVKTRRIDAVRINVRLHSVWILRGMRETVQTHQPVIITHRVPELTEEFLKLNYEPAEESHTHVIWWSRYKE
jgi:FkbM family methyltransferase